MTLYIYECIIKIQGKGNLSKQKGGKIHKKGGKAVEDEKESKEIKELLDVLEKALKSETVERITITIKPNKKNKQS